jgi:NADPH-ferrihemoprotein reductase
MMIGGSGRTTGEVGLGLGLPSSTSDIAKTGGTPREFLRDVDYAVFGLGNRQYEHYNNMGRFVDASLGMCGARRVAALGLGDDDDDLEGDFETWKESVLWPSLVARYVGGASKGETAADDKAKKAGGGGAPIAPPLPPCPYSVEYRPISATTIGGGDADRDADKAASEMILTSSRHYAQAVECPVSARRELRDPSDPGSTVHVEIDVSGLSMDVMKYHTADNLGILPRNDVGTVEAVARALGYDADRRFRLVPNDNDNGDGDGSKKHTLPFPTPCTVRECLERYCDLTGPPRRSDLKQLASYATDDLDRRALLRMSSKEGKAEYREKIVDAHVGIADIVTRLCPSISCPLEHFVMVCPRLQPRYYTISSSSTVHPTTIHITLAVLETERRDENTGEVMVFRGLCSGYLAGLNIGDTVSAFVRESTFRLPKQIERPVIMFGPGTGIAPMRAILQERSHMHRTMEPPTMRERIGSSILYFGCKNRNMDYIYRDELEAFVDEGTLTELHLAFSREKAEKVYVQHLLADRAEETWKMIRDDKASIFVCGAVRMGADVGSTLQDIISSCGGMSRDKAKAYLDGMAVAGRYVQELWSD